VKDMLSSIDSQELSEWQAYEVVNGSLGSRVGDELLMLIHEQLQALNHQQGAANFTDSKHRKNPVPAPVRLPRPWEQLGDGEEK
jgi:hypothetical protein